MTDQAITKTGTGTVLVVDDSKAALMLMATQLRRAGFTVFAVETGEEALEIAFANLPDLILLDINLPGISGFEVMEQLKQRPETAEVPVIMISAAADLQSQVRGFTSGVVDFVIKPTMEPVLLARVRLHLELSRVRHELELSNRQLRTSEARYRLIAENTSDVIWSMDPHSGRFTYVSPTVFRLRGYTAEEVMAQPVEAALTPESRAQVQQLIAEKLAEIAFGNYRNLTSLTEVEQPCKDGSTVWTEVTTSYLLDEAGLLTEIVGVSRDITQRRQHEARLFQIQAQLLQSEKLASIGQLAAGIAHEIRNPLTGISLLLDDLHDRAPLSNNERELLRKALDEIERMERLITSLLSFAAPPRAELRSGDLSKAVASLVLLVRRPCEKQGVVLKLDLDNELPPCRFDAEKLQQALLNLVKNALEAMPDGGELTIRVCSEQGWNLISVGDSGPGIEADDQQLLFEPFFTRKGAGTGLGLSITKRIIEEHGGSLVVASSPGQGACFTVRLPLDDSSATATTD